MPIQSGDLGGTIAKYFPCVHNQVGRWNLPHMARRGHCPPLIGDVLLDWRRPVTQK